MKTFFTKPFTYRVAQALDHMLLFILGSWDVYQ